MWIFLQNHGRPVVSPPYGREPIELVSPDRAPGFVGVTWPKWSSSALEAARLSDVRNSYESHDPYILK